MQSNIHKVQRTSLIIPSTLVRLSSSIIIRCNRPIPPPPFPPLVLNANPKQRRHSNEEDNYTDTESLLENAPDGQSVMYSETDSESEQLDNEGLTERSNGDHGQHLKAPQQFLLKSVRRRKTLTSGKRKHEISTNLLQIQFGPRKRSGSRLKYSSCSDLTQKEIRITFKVQFMFSLSPERDQDQV